LLTVRVNPRTTAAAPLPSVGAVNEGDSVAGLASTTDGPDVCAHEYVSGRAGWFVSDATAVMVTALPDATAWAAPALADGARTVGTVTGWLAVSGTQEIH